MESPVTKRRLRRGLRYRIAVVGQKVGFRIGETVQVRSPLSRYTVLMAKCDEGYICEVCGKDVAAITESDLYLRYVIGMVDPETLHTMRERHIRCNPVLGQFIVDEAFEPIRCEGPFDKHQLDPAFVKDREQLVTRGWRRLKEVVATKLAIVEYPLADFKPRQS